MPIYSYTARDARGKIVSGRTDAVSQAMAARTLREKGLIPTTIQEGVVRAGEVRRIKSRRGRVKIDDLVEMSRQMATMMRAGLHLTEVLDTLAEQSEKTVLKNVLKEVEEDVRGGASLTEAIQKHPRIFSSFFVSMVRAGEASGMLDNVLEQISTNMEKQASIRRKIKSAIAYPLLVLLFAFGVATFLVTCVVPIFQGIYGEMGAALPPPTKLLLAISGFVRTKWYIVLMIVVGAVVGLTQWSKTPGGRLKIDRLKLKLPVLGPLFLKAAIARFSRTFSSLLRAGVPILYAMEIVAKTSGNAVIEIAVLRSRSNIQEGESVAKTINESAVFPPMVVKMINVGERTGALETMLLKVADYYEDQVDTAVSTLTSIIEPILIAFVGVIVGFIVISMFWPLFKMVEELQ